MKTEEPREVVTAPAALDYKAYFMQGVSYAEYVKNMDGEVKNPPASPYAEYIPLNQVRMKRIETVFVPNEAVREALRQRTDKVYWLVITEHWCGDAAQILPVLHAIVEASEGKIDMRMTYRDQHPELMDAHLTGTSRSIPKVIQLNEAFAVTHVWGPRPPVAQEMVLRLKSNPDTAAGYATALHKWYAADHQQSIQDEILHHLLLG